MTSASKKTDLLIPLIERLMILMGQVLFVLLGPFLVARFALQASQVYLPLAVHVIVLIMAFTLLLIWAWLITGERGEKFYKQAYEIRLPWPFLCFPFSLLVFASGLRFPNQHLKRFRLRLV